MVKFTLFPWFAQRCHKRTARDILPRTGVLLRIRSPAKAQATYFTAPLAASLAPSRGVLPAPPSPRAGSRYDRTSSEMTVPPEQPLPNRFLISLLSSGGSAPASTRHRASRRSPSAWSSSWQHRDGRTCCRVQSAAAVSEVAGDDRRRPAAHRWHGMSLVGIGLGVVVSLGAIAGKCWRLSVVSQWCDAAGD